MVVSKGHMIFSGVLVKRSERFTVRKYLYHILSPLEGEIIFTLFDRLSWEGDIKGMGFCKVNFEIGKILE